MARRRNVRPSPPPTGGAKSKHQRSFAVGPLVRIAQEKLTADFRALPAWAQQQTAASLVAMYPLAFKAAGASTATVPPQPGSSLVAKGVSFKDALQKSQTTVKPILKKTSGGTESVDGGNQKVATSGSSNAATPMDLSTDGSVEPAGGSSQKATTGGGNTTTAAKPANAGKAGKPKAKQTVATGQVANDATLPKTGTQKVPAVAKAARPPSQATVTLRRQKAFDRPEVRGLECAARLAKPPSGYSKTEEKKDQALFSAALGAVARGRAAGAQPELIAEALCSVRESKESFSRLWPSKTTRREYAMRKLPKGLATTPIVRSVDDKYIIYTPYKPAGEVDNEVDYTRRPLPLEHVPFHSESADQKSADDDVTDVVRSFLKKEQRDYTALAMYVHCIKGRISLYWLTNKQALVRWGDDDSDMSVGPSPAPKRKKRRTESGEAS